MGRCAASHSANPTQGGHFHDPISIKHSLVSNGRKSCFTGAATGRNWSYALLSLCFMVDLTETHISQIKDMNLVEDDIAYGAITSTVNSFGQTAAWTLTRIKKLRPI